jgi:hypothetical protein
MSMQVLHVCVLGTRSALTRLRVTQVLLLQLLMSPHGAAVKECVAQRRTAGFQLNCQGHAWRRFLQECRLYQVCIIMAMQSRLL